jgi:hypothetical protein
MAGRTAGEVGWKHMSSRYVEPGNLITLQPCALISCLAFVNFSAVSWQMCGTVVVMSQQVSNR